MDETFRRLAALHGGYLHRAHILDHGGTDLMIAASVAQGTLRRIRVGTYVFRDEFDHLTPPKKHLLLARSVIDKFPAGSVALSHHSAAVAHGLDVYDVPLDVVHLVRLDGGSGRRESGVVHHHARPGDDEIVWVDGRLTVEPERAVWEVACDTSRRGALVVMDSALHHEVLTMAELQDPDRRFERWPGSRVARLTARLADGGAANAGESLFRYLTWEHGLPTPSTQLVIVDSEGAFVARTDLGWEEWRHVGELDGLRKYLRDLRPGEDASQVVIREKLREDRIRQEQYGMSRVTWFEVQPQASDLTGARLQHELERSRRLYSKSRTYIVL